MAVASRAARGGARAHGATRAGQRACAHIGGHKPQSGGGFEGRLSSGISCTAPGDEGGVTGEGEGVWGVLGRYQTGCRARLEFLPRRESRRWERQQPQARGGGRPAVGTSTTYVRGKDAVGTSQNSTWARPHMATGAFVAFRPRRSACTPAGESRRRPAGFRLFCRLLRAALRVMRPAFSASRSVLGLPAPPRRLAGMAGTLYLPAARGKQPRERDWRPGLRRGERRSKLVQDGKRWTSVVARRARLTRPSWTTFANLPFALGVPRSLSISIWRKWLALLPSEDLLGLIHTAMDSDGWMQRQKANSDDSGGHRTFGGRS